MAHVCSICLDTIEHEDVTNLRCGHLRYSKGLIKYIQSQPDELKADECMVCNYQKQKDKYVVTKCKHQFHKTCIDPWQAVNKSCPNCRQNLEFKEPESSSRIIINRFKEVLDWNILDNDAVMGLFWNTGSPMLESLDRAVNMKPSRDIGNVNMVYKQCVKNRLEHCIANHNKFKDLTIMIECILKYDSRVLYDMGLSCDISNLISYPPLYSITDDVIEDATYDKLLKTRQIQEQLKDPKVIMATRKVLTRKNDPEKLRLLNLRTPCKCTIM
jgi:hypothetical protein